MGGAIGSHFLCRRVYLSSCLSISLPHPPPPPASFLSSHFSVARTRGAESGSADSAAKSFEGVSNSWECTQHLRKEEESLSLSCFFSDSIAADSATVRVPTAIFLLAAKPTDRVLLLTFCHDHRRPGPAAAAAVVCGGEVPALEIALC